MIMFERLQKVKPVRVFFSKPSFANMEPNPDNRKSGFKGVKPLSDFHTISFGFVILLLDFMVLLP